MMDKSLFFEATQVPSAEYRVDGFGTITIFALSLEDRLKMRGFESHADMMHAIVIAGVEGLDESDMPNVRKMDPEVLGEIATRILELSGMTEEEEAGQKKDSGLTAIS